MSDITFKGNFTDFDLDSNAYAAFDATSIRDLIIERLTDQNIFTDQIFEGSNISSMIDIVAYSYHVLLFYLNRTANESMFSESQIYENMNRIVKLLNYKPVGYQTSTLSIDATAKAALSTGFYTIPRYSFVDIDGVKYSFIKDISFSKTTSADESIPVIGDENLLYQGTYIEYPAQTAIGTDFEPLVLAVTESENIETNSINVYVKDVNTGKYVEYAETESLYLDGPTDKKFEKRFNENEKYEIRFGNGVNGNKLNAGDQIFVYYLRSDGENGTVQANALSNKAITLYTSTQFIDIRNDIKLDNVNYLAFDTIGNLQLTNTLPSTIPNTKEDVSEIRSNAPKFFRSQQRLITSGDFETKIKSSFGNILTDVKVLDNETYVSTYLTYLDSLGLTNPNLESRLLLNQSNFATAINFNNVYIVGVPRLENKTTTNIQSNFISTAQRQLIKNAITRNKVVGSEPVFSDPVYVAFDLCAGDNATASTDLLNVSRLVIEPEEGAIVNAQSLKQSVANVLTTYFDNKNCKLGQLIDITKLSNDILNIDGVKTFYGTRTDDPTLRIEGLNLLAWNPVYPTADIQIINQNLQLDDFKFPYFFDVQGLVDKIII
tara:strand:- start:216 stop:2027 length:1812 start_codon:yes stop_codon:yes gene_type:complete